MAESVIPQVVSTSGSGYCKMPDGTLIQWGVLNFSDVAASSSASNTFTFPEHFVDNNYVAATTSRFTSVPSQRASNVGAKTTSTLTVNIQNNYGALWSSPSVDIIAIGRWK